MIIMIVKEMFIFFSRVNAIVINMVGIIKIIPPIVGVPFLDEWALSKYLFKVCDAFIFFSIGIMNSPNNIDVINPIIMDITDLIIIM